MNKLSKIHGMCVIAIAFYLLGLRIFELSETARHHPKMSDFFRDGSDRWWFKTVGKGNKYREVAVPMSYLHLRDYRQAGLAVRPPRRKHTVGTKISRSGWYRHPSTEKNDPRSI